MIVHRTNWNTLRPNVQAGLLLLWLVRQKALPGVGCYDCEYHPIALSYGVHLQPGGWDDLPLRCQIILSANGWSKEIYEDFCWWYEMPFSNDTEIYLRRFLSWSSPLWGLYPNRQVISQFEVDPSRPRQTSARAS